MISPPSTLAVSTARTVSRAIAVAALVHLAAFAQGLTLVSFPALASLLREIHGFSGERYAAIFLPQALAMVTALSGGGRLSRSFGLKPLLVAGLALNALSQLALAWSALLAPGEAFAVLIGGSTLLGLGFGLAGVPLTRLPARVFPRPREAASLAVPGALGLGLAIGALYATLLVAHKSWLLMPLSLLGLCVLLVVWALLARLPRAAGA